MDNSIVKQVFDVLDKYDKSYTKDGVLKNLNTWEQNKSPLADLLRQHPDWNEDAQAVVIEVTQSREIDRYTVYPLKNSVLDLSMGMDMSNNDRSNLNYALDTAIGPYAKLLPDEQVVSSIKHYSGVSCAVGQKTSRAINRICQRYGLDKHPEYNARFAQLADSLNPMQVKRKALLSVHPCDYLEMSNEDNSWRSCHCIRDGEYHAGALSYMNDAVSMIFYTIDEEVSDCYHMEPKITRQVFCYNNGILLQSRLYPGTDDEEARDIYRDIVQRTISHCLDIPNLWKLHRTQEHVDRYCSTHSNALQYTDYTYKCNRPNVSVSLEAHSGKERKIVIGNTAYCLDCCCQLYHNDTMYCESCNDDTEYINCECCGERIELNSDDDCYLDGTHYCYDCVSWCDSCQEYTRNEMTEVVGQHGYSIRVCECCLDDYYYCEDCGRYFHSDRGTEIEDSFHCHMCLENYYFACDRCGDYERYEDGQEIDSSLYCPDCTKEIRSEMAKVHEECFATV